MEIYIIAIGILVFLAVTDLMVGVSNDAVNFLNSSIGSKVAPRYIIMIIASLGILAGVTFSSGMMEVARKGIFHPRFFHLNEIMVIFLAVMLTDILLLDLYNTFGLPTSTTVSIVFELLGAAVAISIMKVVNSNGNFGDIGTYINSGKALAIIAGILLSVVIAFFFGAIVQFFTRLVFTFDYHKKLKRYGAIWGGLALSAIIYFILIKGSKGAAFMENIHIMGESMKDFIKHYAFYIFAVSFLVFTVIFQIIVMISNYNILKPIVLVGTFALAMAFAANDLVNFIGVPLAGFHSYSVASQALAAGQNPLLITMEALQGKVQSNTGILLIAGIIMVVTLWLSKKARTVTETEVNLGRQDEGFERFGSSPISRTIVRMVSGGFSGVKKIIPTVIQEKISDRLDPEKYNPKDYDKKAKAPSFDLLRASVNLVVASAVVSFATSLKLPLSTTYVTFMVAMGASLSDQAWGRDSAAYRVAGVLAVIGGWFFTAFMAFTVAMTFAFTIYFFQEFAVIGILLLIAFVIIMNHKSHKKRATEKKEMEIFNLRKITDAEKSIAITFEHSGMFLREVQNSLNECLEGLFTNDLGRLREIRKSTKRIQNWANIITANIYKTLRLLSQEDIKDTKNYALIINTLQEIAESHRDIIIRAHSHIDNHHKGLLEVQIQELQDLMEYLNEILDHAIAVLIDKKTADVKKIVKLRDKLRNLADQYDGNQIRRIQDDSSKTRLSILFYAIMMKGRKIARHTNIMLDIFLESFQINGKKKKKK
jgi:phosphate/sulfate permease